MNWRKSSLSQSENDCVETAALPEGGVAVRDSKDPDGGMLTSPPAAWRAFVGATRADAFEASA